MSEQFSRQPRISSESRTPWPEQAPMFYRFPGHYRRSTLAARPYRLRKHRRR